jgi:hypothetical protein
LAVGGRRSDIGRQPSEPRRTVQMCCREMTSLMPNVLALSRTHSRCCNRIADRGARPVASCPRRRGAPAVESGDVVEAAGYATGVSSPGVTAPAAPASGLPSAAGTVTRAIRTPRCGSIARRGRSRATCELPREMRPKRYLPEESKQIWSRLPTPNAGLDRFFSLPGEIWPGLSVSSLSRRSLCGPTASHVPPPAR